MPYDDEDISYVLSFHFYLFGNSFLWISTSNHLIPTQHHKHKNGIQHYKLAHFLVGIG